MALIKIVFSVCDRRREDRDVEMMNEVVLVFEHMVRWKEVKEELFGKFGIERCLGFCEDEGGKYMNICIGLNDMIMESCCILLDVYKFVKFEYLLLLDRLRLMNQNNE